MEGDAGTVPVLVLKTRGPKGQGFDSSSFLHLIRAGNVGGRSGLQPREVGCNSLSLCHRRVAQSAERPSDTRKAGGSNPPSSTIYPLLCTIVVVGDSTHPKTLPPPVVSAAARDLAMVEAPVRSRPGGPLSVQAIW